jgi:hypothetical protein
MSRMSAPFYPQCHPGQVNRPGPAGRPVQTAVWICEYPYRTIRVQGPSEDCSDCPIWRNMQRLRRAGGTAVEDVERLERLERLLTG